MSIVIEPGISLTGGTFTPNIVTNYMGVIQARTTPTGTDWVAPWASTIDAAGNLFVAGLDTAPTFAPDQPAYVAKYNNAGVLQWQQLYSLIGFKVSIYDIVLDGSGNIYVTGGKVNISTGLSSFFMMKLDSLGNINSGIGPISTVDWPNLIGQGIAIDSTGNIYVAGYTVLPNAPATFTEGAVIKFDSSLNVIWQYKYLGPVTGRGPYNVKLYSIKLDSSNRPRITGSTYGASSQDSFLFRLDPTSGNIDVANTIFGGGVNPGTFVKFSFDSSQNMYVTTSYLMGPGGYFSQITAKYDPGSTYLWGRVSYNLSYSTNSKNQAVDSAGNVYVTGVRDFSQTKQNAFVIKYDPNGNLLWERCLFDTNTGASSAELYGMSISVFNNKIYLYVGNTFNIGASEEHSSTGPGPSLFAILEADGSIPYNAPYTIAGASYIYEAMTNSYSIPTVTAPLVSLVVTNPGYTFGASTQWSNSPGTMVTTVAPLQTFN